ncbi:hypothetical protein [Candidatus Ishikawella capsulata]|uniref:hypothetical protein n=1 Tax=Candidatus Ishikawella capsulata TaxID=168169 RepID=UPI0005979F46|nr:hypothetical protein [Candidatus Ishikawaella capsulata]
MNDIIYKFKLNHNYLSKNGFELYLRNADDYQRIDITKINSKIISPSSFPYYIRQLLSTINAMGRYKFDLPNLNSVYLHDAPHHDLFKSHIRVCIRIDKAAHDTYQKYT